LVSTASTRGAPIAEAHGIAGQEVGVDDATGLDARLLLALAQFFDKRFVTGNLGTQYVSQRTLALRRALVALEPQNLIIGNIVLPVEYTAMHRFPWLVNSSLCMELEELLGVAAVFNAVDLFWEVTRYSLFEANACLPYGMLDFNAMTWSFTQTKMPVFTVGYLGPKRNDFAGELT
jgi:hypothetical protein